MFQLQQSFDCTIPAWLGWCESYHRFTESAFRRVSDVWKFCILEGFAFFKHFMQEVGKETHQLTVKTYSPARAALKSAVFCKKPTKWNYIKSTIDWKLHFFHTPLVSYLVNWREEAIFFIPKQPCSFLSVCKTLLLDLECLSDRRLMWDTSSARKPKSDRRTRCLRWNTLPLYMHVFTICQVRAIFQWGSHAHTYTMWHTHAHTKLLSLLPFFL